MSSRSSTQRRLTSAEAREVADRWLQERPRSSGPVLETTGEPGNWRRLVFYATKPVGHEGLCFGAPPVAVDSTTGRVGWCQEAWLELGDGLYWNQRVWRRWKRLWGYKVLR